MPSKKNIEKLEKIKQKVDKATAMFFVDYQRLTHKQLEEVRTTLKENNSEIAISKNTLMNLALKDKKIDVSDKLFGPFATMFSYEDPIKTAKALYTFFKKYELPKIKFGIFDGKVIEEQDVINLANIPSREVLLGKFVGLLKSPMTNLVYSLNYNITKLALVLKEIEKKKSV